MAGAGQRHAGGRGHGPGDASGRRVRADLDCSRGDASRRVARRPQVGGSTALLTLPRECPSVTAGPGYDGDRQAEVLEPVRRGPGGARWRRSCGGTDSMISSIGSLKIVSSIASIGSWRTDTDADHRPAGGLLELRAAPAAGPPRPRGALSCRSGCSRCSSARAGFSTTTRNCDVARLAPGARWPRAGRLWGRPWSVTTRTRVMRSSDMRCSFVVVGEPGVRRLRTGSASTRSVRSLLGLGQVDHDREDRAEEQHAGAEGAEAEAAVGVRGGRGSRRCWRPAGGSGCRPARSDSTGPAPSCQATSTARIRPERQQHRRRRATSRSARGSSRRPRCRGRR